MLKFAKYKFRHRAQFAQAIYKLSKASLGVPDNHHQEVKASCDMILPTSLLSDNLGLQGNRRTDNQASLSGNLDQIGDYRQER